MNKYQTLREWLDSSDRNQEAMRRTKNKLRSK